MTETREKTVCRLPELKERHLPGDCREAVYTLLKETYGYEQFRDLEVYDDLFKGKDTLQISQGQLIESVIVEAEKARNGGEDVDNILLTAPTGAGKSLLFQLPAIYLGNEYGMLTIVLESIDCRPGGRLAGIGVHACGVCLFRFVARTEERSVQAGA